MKVTIEDVRHIAHLSRLDYDEESMESLRGEMEALLSYFSRISELDTAGVPPTTGVLPLKNVLREDVARPGLSQEEALGNAPEQEGGFFRIRAILASQE
jgi:aspartyl-tRNA(Asn)/glutamyl-tRNA(Gln) amidotransferase subunit C